MPQVVHSLVIHLGELLEEHPNGFLALAAVPVPRESGQIVDEQGHQSVALRVQRLVVDWVELSNLNGRLQPTNEERGTHFAAQFPVILSLLANGHRVRLKEKERNECTSIIN